MATTYKQQRHDEPMRADEHNASRRVEHDEIERRAYDLYRERGAEDGHDMDDWLAAERELVDK